MHSSQRLRALSAVFPSSAVSESFPILLLPPLLCPQIEVPFQVESGFLPTEQEYDSDRLRDHSEQVSVPGDPRAAEKRATCSDFGPRVWTLGCGLRLGGRKEVPGPDPPRGQSARGLAEPEGPDCYAGHNSSPLHGIGSLESAQLHARDSLLAEESCDHEPDYLNWNSSAPGDNLRSKGNALPTFSPPARKPSTESWKSSIGELINISFPLLS